MVVSTTESSNLFPLGRLAKMGRYLGVAWLVLGVLAGLLPRMSFAQTLTDNDLKITTVASGISAPTGFAFLGNNDMFALERFEGKVERVQNGVVTDTVLDLEVNTSFARGLLGIALHPDFDTNNYVYLYYSADNSGNDSSDPDSWTENRVSRFTWDGSQLTSELVLKSFARDPDQINDSTHQAGPLMFAPDGTLIGSVGDLSRNRAERNNPPLADESMGAGGLYRLNAPGDATDGSIPADNPFVSHANSDFHLWYAYGVRNTFGLDIDPVTGAVWDTENGPDRMDEINMVAPGFNSGWNILMGPEAFDPEGQTASDLVDLGTGSTYSDPEFSTSSTIGITDLAFLSGSLLGPSYDDAVIFGGSNTLNDGRISILRLNAQRDGFDLSGDLADTVAEADDLDTIEFGEGFGTTTDMQIGPDGALYVMSFSNGTIYRIVGIPEPSTILLLVVGAVSLLSGRRNS